MFETYTPSLEFSVIKISLFPVFYNTSHFLYYDSSIKIDCTVRGLCDAKNLVPASDVVFFWIRDRSYIFVSAFH